MRLRQLSGQVPGVELDNALRNVILDEMEAACPMLGVAEFYQHNGSADAPRKNATAVGGTVRAIDAEYTPVVTAPVYGASALKIYGDEIQTDLAYERRGVDVGGEHLRQLRSFGRSLGRHLQNAIFNAEVDATNINGLKELCDASMLFTFDEDGDGTVPLGSTDALVLQQRSFLEQLDELIMSIAGGAQFLAMDAKTRNRLKSIAMDFVSVTSTMDALGNRQELTMYNGIPIIIGGYTSDESGLVIPHTETVADPVRATCTSIYAGRYSEKADLTFATNVGVQVLGPTRGKTFVNTVIDFDIDQLLLNTKALARLQGVIIGQPAGV